MDNTKELQDIINQLEDASGKLVEQKNYIDKCFEFKIQPEHISASGLNLFKVLGYRYVYSPKPSLRKIAIKLAMGCGQEKTVKFIEAPNRFAIDEIKKALKHGNTVYISLHDIILTSYHFNNSSGISMYSNGFRIISVIPNEEKV